ncbi:MAG TPA: hypothetical protein VFL60_03000 [Gaiellaceae bacterium]|nr:hypothetical protein [Gaiellaceae bacterium]
MTVSRPVKILALILVLAGVGGIASLKLLGKSSGTAGASTLSVAEIRARAHGTSATSSAPAAKPKPAARPVHRAVQPKPRPAPAPVHRVRKPAATTAANGLPIVLADALKAHRIVVVSVFDPQSQTDAVSYAEARAGAADAHAGFLGVSVLDDVVAAPLTASLPGGGLLPLPGTLIYRAPGTLVERVDGFADRSSVAGLAANARSAPPLSAAPASTGAATTASAPAPAPAPAATDTTTTP